MTIKPYHGVTLWAVPRFHRSDFTPLQAEPDAAHTARLQTYSFMLDADTPAPPSESPEHFEKLQICH